jgi:cation transport regulator ChaC
MNDVCGTTINYFGYGSLVNLETLQTPYVSAQPATLKRWKRVWLSRPELKNSFAPFAGLAFLSVMPSRETQIEGMLVQDYASSLPSLDDREALYDRVELPDHALLLHSDGAVNCDQSYLYVAQPIDTTLQEKPKILRSYLDVVFQGYLQHFGEASLSRFVETTDNFDLDVLEDRENPIYPRATKCSRSELKLFDAIVPAGGLIGR